MRWSWPVLKYYASVRFEVLAVIILIFVYLPAETENPPKKVSFGITSLAFNNRTLGRLLYEASMPAT
jgi:hypothetical protein